MRIKFRLSVCVIIALTALACSGKMKGLDRYTGKRVYFTYEDQKFGSGQIQIAMPDGERFSGQIIEDSGAAPSQKEYPAVDEFPGDTEAYLYGDRGTEMKCKFRLSDRVLGFKGGGFGLCETSHDHVIDIFLR